MAKLKSKSEMDLETELRRERTIRSLELIMKNALSRMDGRTYYNVCNRLAIEPANKILYEQGKAEIEFYLNKNNPEIVKTQETNPERGTVFAWENLTRISRKRFSELQRGESIGVLEIKRRLGEIAEAGRSIGYELKPYSALNHEQAWAYLGKIRRQIFDKARIVCPHVLNEIDKKNEQQIQDAENYR